MVTIQGSLSRAHNVDLLNLTRDHDYEAGVLNGGNVLRTLSDVWGVFRQAGSHDVVYVHSAFVPLVTMIRSTMLLVAARLRGARTVLHVHGGSLPAWANSAGRKRALKILLAPAHAVIAVSDDIASVLPQKRTTVIYNGVDLDRFTPRVGENPQPPVILFIGLLTRRKGVVDLLEASEILRNRSVDHRLVLVGGRPDEGGAEESIVRAASTGVEEFIGAVSHSEIPGHLQQAAIFCLPSWYEAMPLSILEAMACGVPIVATNVGQIPQVVTPDFGRLINPKDPTALADALESLLTDPDLHQRAASAARTEAERSYGLTATVDSIDTAIRSAAT